MADLRDGETFYMQGSSAKPYELRNIGGVYSCSCPAWRNQGANPNRRTCKHLRKLRGDAAEDARIGASGPGAPAAPRSAPARASASAQEGPPLLLAHAWDHAQDPQGWWMSEKLDGVRAYWDGQQFISRLGNPYLAPAWFTAGLPATPLDGELWVGRKKFQRCISIVRRQDMGPDWQLVRYLVFDAPAQQAPFEQRMDSLRAHFAQHKPPYAEHHPHVRCNGIDHLRQELARVEALGGEGLMLREPASRYQVGRSSTLLKVKSFFDAEARVVGHQAGAGKHLGRLGALEVEMPNGTRFHVGTGFTDAERRQPPPVGAVITYRYQELSEGGVPRFPSFVALREDLPWPPPAGGSAPPPRPAQAPAAAPAATPTRLRYFEREQGGAREFWELGVAGTTLVLRSGPAGSEGQRREQRFASPTEAVAEARRLIGAWVAEGYLER